MQSTTNPTLKRMPSYARRAHSTFLHAIVDSVENGTFVLSGLDPYFTLRFVIHTQVF